MTIHEIVKAYLREHGYDGLVGRRRRCACTIEDAPLCDFFVLDCEAAHIRPATQEDVDELGGGIEVGNRIFSPKKEG